ncbi:hypothetical protein ACQ4PT_026389 [Festuca glaucescens]
MGQGNPTMDTSKWASAAQVWTAQDIPITTRAVEGIRVSPFRLDPSYLFDAASTPLQEQKKLEVLVMTTPPEKKQPVQLRPSNLYNAASSTVKQKEKNLKEMVMKTTTEKHVHVRSSNHYTAASSPLQQQKKNLENIRKHLEEDNIEVPAKRVKMDSCKNGTRINSEEEEYEGDYISEEDDYISEEDDYISEEDDYVSEEDDYVSEEDDYIADDDDDDDDETRRLTVRGPGYTGEESFDEHCIFGNEVEMTFN